nr:hypothetical protein [uncultured Methanospirillum sp.]
MDSVFFQIRKQTVDFCSTHSRALIAGYLCICCVIGLICKCLVAVLQPLTSDTVVPGLMAMEIWNHGNPLLNDFVLPAPDPNILEDICFFFVPQVLSDFSPLVLKLTGYVQFLAIILVFSLILYSVLKNKTAVLLFIALMASCCPSTQIWHLYYYASKYLLPVFHNSTVIFLGILMYLTFVKKWDTFPRIIIPICILIIVTISDSLLVIWFVVPLAVMYVLFWNTDYQPRLIFVASAGIASILAHFIKYFNPMLFEYGDFTFKLFSRTETDFSNFFTILQSYLIPDLFYPGQIPRTILIVVIMAVLVVLTFYIKRTALPETDKRLVIFSLLSIVCTMGIIIVFSEMDAWAYISQIPVLAYLAAIIVIFHSHSRITWAQYLLILLVTVNLVMMAGLIASLNTSPNEEQYKLIDTLSQNGVRFAYANFWDANVITYLSHDTLTVRSVEYTGILAPFIGGAMNIRWFERHTMDEMPLTLIIKNSDPGDLLPFISKNPPDRFNDLDFYSVVQYDSLNQTAFTDVPKNWRERLGSTNIGMSRILEKITLLTRRPESS